MLTATGVVASKMTGTVLRQKNADTLPAGVLTISLFVLVVGVLGLVGAFFPPRDAKSIYGAAESIILTSTAILVLCNHKWAVMFAFLAAASLTVGSVFDYPLLRHFSFSIPAISQAMRFLFHATLYWVAYIWYKKWRCTPVSGGSRNA